MRIWAFDLETFLITPGRHAPPMVCLSHYDGQEPAEVLHARFDRDKVRVRLGAELADPDCTIVGANVAFDLAVVCEEFPELLPAVFDAYAQDRVVCIQVAQRLLDLARNALGGEHTATGWVEHKYSLAGLSKRHLGIDMDKDTWRLRYGTLIDTPCEAWPEGAVEYSVLDSVSTWEVLRVQRQTLLADGHPMGSSTLLRPDDVLADVYRQTRAQWWLHLMVARGFRTDPEMVARLERLVTEQKDAAEQRLKAAGLVRAAGTRDTKAAAARMRAVCEAKGLIVKETAKGQVALDEEACEDSGDALLRDYARFTSLAGILNKDIPALRQPLVQSRFETLVETGRTSCSGSGKSGGYQLQNVRRKLGLDGVDEDEIGVRQCFVPRPGFYLLSCDYSMMELHAWAQVQVDLVGGSALAEALNAGKDVHLELGAKILGIRYEEALERKKSPSVKEARQMAKAANFGFPGGLSARAFKSYAKASYGVLLSESQARGLRDAWELAWRPFPYFAHIRQLVGEAGLGRVVHVRSGRQRAWVPYTVAANSYFQGLAADAAKDAGFRLARACYVQKDSPLYGSRTVNFVHDEFLVEVPIERAHEAGYECARVMMEAAADWMPDCPPKVEPALMTRWIKSAEARHDAQGRLVPWA